MRKLTHIEKKFVRDMLRGIEGPNRLGIAKWLIGIAIEAR